MASYKYILRTSQALFTRDEVSSIVSECENFEREIVSLKEKMKHYDYAKEVIQSALDEDDFCVYCGGRDSHTLICRGNNWIKKYYKLKNG